VQANHDLSRVCATFDEANLVPNAGLLPAAVLAQRIGLGGLVGHARPARGHRSFIISSFSTTTPQISGGSLGLAEGGWSGDERVLRLLEQPGEVGGEHRCRRGDGLSGLLEVLVVGDGAMQMTGIAELVTLAGL